MSGAWVRIREAWTTLIQFFFKNPLAQYPDWPLLWSPCEQLQTLLLEVPSTCLPALPLQGRGLWERRKDSYTLNCQKRKQKWVTLEMRGFIGVLEQVWKLLHWLDGAPLFWYFLASLRSASIADLGLTLKKELNFMNWGPTFNCLLFINGYMLLLLGSQNCSAKLEGRHLPIFRLPEVSLWGTWGVMGGARFGLSFGLQGSPTLHSRWG